MLVLYPAIEDDNSRNKSGTPKKAMRTKSNLEPVHEVPFEEKIPLEEEERWSKVPQEQLPSAFKQYRKEVMFSFKLFHFTQIYSAEYVV